MLVASGPRPVWTVVHDSQQHFKSFCGVSARVLLLRNWIGSKNLINQYFTASGPRPIVLVVTSQTVAKIP